jgi:hypothetical protein
MHQITNKITYNKLSLNPMLKKHENEDTYHQKNQFVLKTHICSCVYSFII